MVELIYQGRFVSNMSKTGHCLRVNMFGPWRKTFILLETNWSYNPHGGWRKKKTVLKKWTATSRRWNWLFSTCSTRHLFIYSAKLLPELQNPHPHFAIRTKAYRSVDTMSLRFLPQMTLLRHNPGSSPPEFVGRLSGCSALICFQEFNSLRCQQNNFSTVCGKGHFSHF